MKHILKKLSVLLLVLAMILGMSAQAFAAVSKDSLENAIADTAKYLVDTVKDPKTGSIGGEWVILGLARCGYPVPEGYYEKYYSAIEENVKEKEGILHQKKYTEYSRTIVGLSAIGKDARDVAGYDLTYPLGDYDKTIWQGLNGPIWALIALDSLDYPMPQNKEAKTQATRQMYIDRILECELEDGGWSLFGGTSSASAADSVADPDITGMALQALAKYQDQEAVKEATEKALSCISKMQNKEGGFSSWGTANSESCAQVITALCELGVSLDDARFEKNGKSLLDNLMSFYIPGKGFKHIADAGSNQMATEQAFYTIVGALRVAQGKNSLYRMGDAISIDVSVSDDDSVGLPGKHEAVKKLPITKPGKTFDDISGDKAHKNQPAIEAMAERDIIKGKTDTIFDPNAKMTRCEFATIVVRVLGLTPKANDVFKDVSEKAWYAAYIGTAYDMGLVNGVSANEFNPEGTITRQEAATLVSRAAKLCGIETDLDSATVREMLAQFGDYTKCANWAKTGLAVCYQNNILDQDDLDILPTQDILRCEVAQMLYNLLEASKLL